MRSVFVLVLSVVTVSCAQLPRRYTTEKPLTQEEIAERNERTYERVTKKIADGKIRFEGGNGSSMEDAIKIVGAGHTGEGINAENIWISAKHGERGIDWNKTGQSLDFSDDERRQYDIIEIEITASGEKVSYFFDITSFFGKH